MPASGRFTFGYVLLTAVGESVERRTPTSGPSQGTSQLPAQAPEIKASGTQLDESLVRQLSHVWTDFENRVNNVPIVAKMLERRWTVRDYRELLYNLRQQVIAGMARIRSFTMTAHDPTLALECLSLEIKLRPDQPISIRCQRATLLAKDR